ncbi:MAG: hypothetical protein IKN43_03820 [Selenomonadaceae bacterium]|nr:hypothetical protein [Selenomonadaceae bacterium]
MKSEDLLLPEIIVFAGPNGSGKSTLVKLAKIVEPYINADDIKRAECCSNMEAAQKAELLREKLLESKQGFTFETVLSTDRNLNLLQRAKKIGFFIRCIYALTANPFVNVMRIKSRVANGGHDVPRDKIYSRYEKALRLIPELVGACDVMHIYDNTDKPFRIFKKRKDKYFYWENDFWNKDKIMELVEIKLDVL